MSHSTAGAEQLLCEALALWPCHHAAVLFSGDALRSTQRGLRTRVQYWAEVLVWELERPFLYDERRWRIWDLQHLLAAEQSYPGGLKISVIPATLRKKQTSETVHPGLTLSCAFSADVLLKVFNDCHDS